MSDDPVHDYFLLRLGQTPLADFLSMIRFALKNDVDTFMRFIQKTTSIPACCQADDGTPLFSAPIAILRRALSSRG